MIESAEICTTRICSLCRYSGISMTTSAPISHDSTSTQHNQSAQQPLPTSCLKLKGSLVPMTVLELLYYDETKVEQELKAKTSQAPGFFENLPVIFDLDKLNDESPIPFRQLIEQCRTHSIKVVAVRGGSDAHQQAAKEAGLGLLAKQKEKAADKSENEAMDPSQHSSNPASTEPVREVETVEVVKEVVKTVVQNQRQQSKIVHHPIRSGQQVYAADGDLIILASVSAGAEILADGNIHVYGSLRGRALAGVKGDASARIFCQSMQAELVSVAGNYKISEDIQKNVIGKPSQVYLDNDTLTFKALEL